MLILQLCYYDCEIYKLLNFATFFKFPCIVQIYPDSKIHGANMGPTWVLLGPGGPHAGPIKHAIRVCMIFNALEKSP